MVARILGLLLAALVMLNTSSASAQTAAEPIRYTLRFPAPQTHYVDVEAVVPTRGQSTVELMMAVWTPGSYMVREYSRNVEAVTASTEDGLPLKIEKSDKNRWRLETVGRPAVRVTYRVYAREMTVRTNWVEADFAMLNGAPTFMTLGDGVPRPHEVTIAPAPGWRVSMTALPELPGGPHRYRALDYDTLVDSPIVVGNPTVHEFTVGGRAHYLVDVGDAGVFNGAQAARDMEAVVAECLKMWGELPYDKYVLFNILTLTEGGGGLEHKSSAMLMSSRWATGSRRAYLSWLGLAAHEYFHAWNIKRLRPVELGPFDYESEVLTRSLWVAEGVTDYYADLILHRAGLSTREEMLDGISNQIEALQTTPGRLVQSVAQASFDAWIKYYRPDENSPNVSISYYTKGAVLAFLLDAKIRAASGGERSLDDVMRAAFQRFSGARGFTPEQFRVVAEQVGGVDLASFWSTAVEGTEELDYSEALETFGLRFRPVPDQGTGRGRAWLGVATRDDAGRLVVSQVRRDAPAYSAGLNVDDEILALNGFRVRAGQLAARLDQYTPGEKVALLVARRDQILTLEMEFGVEPPRQWRLEVDFEAVPAERQRNRWLTSNA